MVKCARDPSRSPTAPVLFRVEPVTGRRQPLSVAGRHNTKLVQNFGWLAHLGETKLGGTICYGGRAGFKGLWHLPAGGAEFMEIGGEPIAIEETNSVVVLSDGNSKLERVDLTTGRREQLFPRSAQ